MAGKLEESQYDWRRGEEVVREDGMTAGDYAESHGASRESEIGVKKVGVEAVGVKEIGVRKVGMRGWE